MTPESMLQALLEKTPTWAWQEHAKCKGLDDNTFYPEYPINHGHLHHVAKEYCSQCPVQRECLTTGWEDLYGIWGGTTGRQRKLVRRKLQQQAA